MALGGEAGAAARVELADLLFEIDRADEAQEQLDLVQHEKPMSPLPYHHAAELLEERGDLGSAQTWINMAVLRFTDEDWDDNGEPLNLLAASVLSCRRRLRRGAGLPEDRVDLAVESGRQRLAEQLGMRPKRPTKARITFWPRAELDKARALWSDRLDLPDPEEFYRERQATNAELIDSGGITAIVMVPLTVTGLIDYATRHGLDPVNAESRSSFSVEVIAAGGAIRWPPARNDVCWCGSAVKYKKCCGRPV